MANCFVFKDETGRTHGYIQQLQRIIRYGIKTEAKGDGCRLVLLFDDESIENLVIVQNEEEREHFVQEEKRLIGGCIMSGGSISAATDQRVRRLFHERFQSVKRIDQKQQEQSDSATIERPQESKPLQFVRRWPPNPCCPFMSAE